MIFMSGVQQREHCMYVCKYVLKTIMDGSTLYKITDVRALSVHFMHSMAYTYDRTNKYYSVRPYKNATP